LEKNKIEKEKEINMEKIKLNSMNDNNKYEEDKKEIENSHIIEMKKKRIRSNDEKK